MTQLTLGQLIDRLEAIDAAPHCIVQFDFAKLQPESVNTYRGYYKHAAIGYADRPSNQLLRDFIQTLTSAVGRDFWGYKGGTYTITRNSPVWASNWGQDSQTIIADAIPTLTVDQTSEVTLITQYKP